MLCTPLYPMVLLIIIPFLNGYFIGNIPNIFRQTQILYDRVNLDPHRCFLWWFSNGIASSIAMDNQRFCGLKRLHRNFSRNNSVFSFCGCFSVHHPSSVILGNMHPSSPAQIAAQGSAREIQYQLNEPCAAKKNTHRWWWHRVECFLGLQNWNHTQIATKSA